MLLATACADKNQRYSWFQSLS